MHLRHIAHCRHPRHSRHHHHPITIPTKAPLHHHHFPIAITITPPCHHCHLMFSSSPRSYGSPPLAFQLSTIVLHPWYNDEATTFQRKEQGTWRSASGASHYNDSVASPSPQPSLWATEPLVTLTRKTHPASGFIYPDMGSLSKLERNLSAEPSCSSGSVSVDTLQRGKLTINTPEPHPARQEQRRP